MRPGAATSVVSGCAGLLALLAGAGAVRGTPERMAWNAANSARYLDSREVWWQSWPRASRDQATQCVSCHTQVPYALARPLLRGPLGEDAPSAPEQKMLADVTRRVALWDNVEPFYKDPAPTRGMEARATEAVLNALILASYGAGKPTLSASARAAFDHAWALQVTTGDDAGAWVWLDFHNTPWEGEGSGYQGATLAALAVGLAPPAYRDEPAVRAHVELLRGYLQRKYAEQPMMNKAVLLWTSARLPGLLTPTQQSDLTRDLFALQQPDGGWSLTALGSWKRHDETPLETRSDGLATGLAVLAMEQAGVGGNSARPDPRMQAALKWLAANQDAAEGSWAGYSLNRQRDPKADAAKFMTDAATAYASMALTQSRPGGKAGN